MSRPAVDPAVSSRGTSLRKDAVGAGDIVFFVVAAAAPLSGVVLGFPVIVATGNGVGAPGAYLVATAVLLVFAVGYTAMSRRVVSAGGFFAYIAHGLGLPAGLGAATLAVLSYGLVQLGMYGAFGVYMAEASVRYFRGSPPWWVWAFAAMALCLFLGVRRVEVGAKLLGVALVLETSVIVVLDIVILVTGGASRAGPGGLSLVPFAPAVVFSGAIGIALMFAHAAFIGFEATAIYGQEARDPRRTVPRATYIAITTMGAFFAVSTALIINGFGTAEAPAVATASTEQFAFLAIGRYLGPVVADAASALIITSVFAALLAFHNSVARYLHAMGRHGVTWAWLGTTHGTRQSPYAACLAQTLFAGVGVGAFVVFDRDPFRELFVWATGLGAIGIIALQAVTSIAVVVFFRRVPGEEGVLRTLLAPVLSGIGLFAFLALALVNFSALVGTDDPGMVAAMNLLLWGTAAAGVGRAVYLRRARPSSYEAARAAVTGDVFAPTQPREK